MENIEIRTAWKKDDPALARDVVALWESLNFVLPREREERLKDLVAVACEDGKAIGACTAKPIDYRVLRTRVFYMRIAIPPGPRHDGILVKLLSASKTILGEWARENGDEKLKGILVMFDSDAFDALYPEPVLRGPGFELFLTGYTDEGRQIRVLWFDDARFEK